MSNANNLGASRSETLIINRASQREKQNKLYMTLITETHDFEFFLKKEIDKKYSKVCLKSIYIQHENDVNKFFVFEERLIKKPLFVHCSLLNKIDTLIMNEHADVIEILYPDSVRIQKNISMKLCNNSGKLIMHSNRIRLHLTSYENEPIENKGKFVIFYELEFS